MISSCYSYLVPELTRARLTTSKHILVSTSSSWFIHTFPRNGKVVSMFSNVQSAPKPLLYLPAKKIEEQKCILTYKFFPLKNPEYDRQINLWKCEYINTRAVAYFFFYIYSWPSPLCTLHWSLLEKSTLCRSCSGYTP